MGTIVAVTNGPSTELWHDPDSSDRTREVRVQALSAVFSVDLASREPVSVSSSYVQSAWFARLLNTRLSQSGTRAETVLAVARDVWTYDGTRPLSDLVFVPLADQLTTTVDAACRLIVDGVPLDWIASFHHPPVAESWMVDLPAREVILRQIGLGRSVDDEVVRLVDSCHRSVLGLMHDELVSPPWTAS